MSCLRSGVVRTPDHPVSVVFVGHFDRTIVSAFAELSQPLLPAGTALPTHRIETSFHCTSLVPSMTPSVCPMVRILHDHTEAQRGKNPWNPGGLLNRQIVGTAPTCPSLPHHLQPPSSASPLRSC